MSKFLTWACPGRCGSAAIVRESARESSEDLGSLSVGRLPQMWRAPLRQGTILVLVMSLERGCRRPESWRASLRCAGVWWLYASTEFPERTGHKLGVYRPQG